jgi:hypothetical protein
VSTSSATRSIAARQDRPRHPPAVHDLRDDLGRHAVGRAEQLLGQRLDHPALGQRATVPQQQHAVGEHQRAVGRVRRHHHGQPALPRQVRHHLQHPELVARVEVGVGLVHQQDVAALRQPAGDQHQLALAAAELGVAPVAEVGQADQRQRVERDRLVLGPGPRRRRGGARGP